MNKRFTYNYLTNATAQNMCIFYFGETEDFAIGVVF